MSEELKRSMTVMSHHIENTYKKIKLLEKKKTKTL